MITAALSGLTLALVSILHCIGMCGPLAIAMKSKFSSDSIGAILHYHMGRLLVYVTLGLIAKTIGNGLLIIIPSQAFTIFIGILLLASILMKNKITHWLSDTPFYKYILSIYKKTNNPLILGMANGLLPCGLVFTAIGLALLFKSLPETLIFMAGFGLGTFPATMFVQGLSQRFEIKKYLSPKLSKYALYTMAFLLIIRGLNLGIPYLSPKIVVSDQQTKLECCKTQNIAE